MGGAREWLAEVVKRAQALKVNAGTEPSTDMGPVISKRAQTRIEALIDSGLEEGTELLLGGRGVQVPGYPDGNFVSPTVLCSSADSGEGGSDAGVLSSVQPGVPIVDGSNTAPATVRRLAQRAAAQGNPLVDAPVSGAAGTGQVDKICNNLLLTISMIGVAEAMSLGAALGIDPQVMSGIVNTSPGRCWRANTCNPYPGVMPNVPAARGYSGGLGVDRMRKDLSLANEAARHCMKPCRWAHRSCSSTSCGAGRAMVSSIFRPSSSSCRRDARSTDPPKEHP